MNGHPEREDDDAEKQNHGGLEHDADEDTTTISVKKKDSPHPPKNGRNPATLKPLTVEDAYKEITRCGSKASYALERYQEEPEPRRLDQVVRAVVAGKGMDVTYSREHAPIVEEAVEYLEAEYRANRQRYGRMVEERMASLEAEFEESLKEAEPHKLGDYLQATYIGPGPKHGITGKAYPRGDEAYWFQPDTGAMGVRVKAEDLKLLNSETSEE